VVSLTDVFRQSTATAAAALPYMADSSADERCVHAVGVGMALLNTSSQHQYHRGLALPAGMLMRVLVAMHASRSLPGVAAEEALRVSIKGLEGERQWCCITAGGTSPAVTHKADAHLALGASITHHQSMAWAAVALYLLQKGLTAVQMPCQAGLDSATA
jgi:hypothetical protein